MDKLVEQLMKEKVQMKAEIFYLKQSIYDLQKDLAVYINPPVPEGPDDQEQFWTNT
jgi:hypothetical protein